MTVRDIIPDVLAAKDQWICWRNECRECRHVHPPEQKECPDCDDGGDVTKIPIDPETEEFASTTDPDTWASMGEAAEYDENHDTHGVGFVFSEEDDITGVDLDDCRNPETEEVEDWAQKIITTVGSFTEISPSGTGFHIYVYGEVPEGGNRHGGVEMYDSARYFTVTGDHVARTPGAINPRQDELEAIHATHINTGRGDGGDGGDDGGDGDGGSDIVDFGLEIPGDFEEETFKNDLGETLDEIRDRDGKLDRLLEELEGKYKSPSEADMATVSKLWFWRFDRQTIAKILRTHRRRPKVIKRDDYLELTISKAATGDRYDPRPSSDYDIEILNEREHYDSVREAEFPDDKHFVLDKPPRGGGSHTSLDVLSESPVVALVSRHAIAEHHLGILDDVMPESACAVHLVGRHKACDNSDKDRCPASTETLKDKNALRHEVKDIVHQKRQVTKDDCPDGFCKYEFLKVCEQEAHAVVTVPQLLSKLERDFEGDNLLIDEEQALGHFRPDSVSLVEVTQAYEPDGTRNVQVVSSPINNQTAAFDKIRNQIEEDQEKRKEQADAEGRNWRRTSWEIDIVNAIEYLEEVREALGVTDAVEELQEDDESSQMKNVIDRLIERVEDIDRPEPHTDPDRFRSKLADYTARFYYDDCMNPGAYIEAVLFPYENKPFDFKHAGPGHRIRMIGGRQIFNAAILREFEQIGLIAGPEGEMLLDDLDLDAKAVEIEEFRYADDFMIIPMAKYGDNTPEDPRIQRERTRRVSKYLNKKAHPHMGVAGTKERAQNFHSDLDTGLADVIANPDSPSKDIYTSWSAGQTAIIYANSAISRGVDAPLFDISVVLSTEFAKPYWKARKSYLLDEHSDDDDRYQEAAAIEAELKANELTNAVLRPAPTPYIDDHYGTKFIVVAKFDVQRLKYLQDNVLPRFAYAEKAANFLEQLTAPGGLRETIDDVYDEVGGDERVFFEVASQEEFEEMGHDRPDYDYDDLESWIEHSYLFKSRVCDLVFDVLTDLDGPTATEIREQLPSLPSGELYAALDVLKRKGRVKSWDEEPDGPGRPPTRWEIDT